MEVLSPDTVSAESRLLLTCRNLSVSLGLKQIDFATVISFLKSVKSTDTLLRAASAAPSVAGWCGSEEMDTYWQPRWAMLGRHPTWREAQENSELSYTNMIPQAGISCFDLVRGMWLFNKADSIARSGEITPAAMRQLNQALSLHCFEAIKAKKILMRQAFLRDELDDPEQIFSMLTHHASVHGSPVFLLMAETAVQFAYHFENNDDDNTAYNYYVRALFYVMVAERMHDESAAAIHNAYYGHGLQSSNPYGLTDYDEWKKKIISDINDDDKQQAVPAATRLLNYYFEPTPTETLNP